MPFQIVRNDITRMNTDVIVNTANPKVCVGEGVDTAIYQAAGWDELMAARACIGDLRLGDVAVTSGYRLPVTYIFHACGPRYIDGESGEAEMLCACYDKCLMLAAKYGCNSIAFPLMSTGSYGFPRELGMKIAVTVISSFLMEHEMDIYLVVLDDASTKLSGELFFDVKHYVDERYAAAKLQSEYLMKGAPYRRAMAPGVRRDSEGISCDSAMMPGAQMPTTDAKQQREAFDGDVSTVAYACGASIEDMLNAYMGNFAEYLQRLINKKGFTNAEVYKRANLTKQYFSKLINGRINPTKEKLLCISVALKLNLDETTDLLRYSGYALSPCSKTDLIFEYFITRGDYDIYSIDIMLFDYGLPSLMD